MTDIREAFDEAVKKNLVAGMVPEEAVGQAQRSVGISLTREMEQNLIDTLKYIQAQSDPEFRKKQQTLAARIRVHMLEGLSTRAAVQKAQETTGIVLGEQGEKLLIQALEGEREKMKDVAVDVISEREYADMKPKVCIFYHLNGKDGWACCQCGEHNRKNQDACTMCGHGRCYAT